MEQLKMLEQVLECEGNRFEEELMEEMEARRLMQIQREAEEKLMEAEKIKFAEEMKEKREARRQCEAQRDAENQLEMDEAREVLHKKGVEVQERLMLLKEQELKLRERAVEMAEERTQNVDESTGAAGVFQSSMSISDPAGDIVCDLSMCLPLEKSLWNERHSVTTVEGLLDNALMMITICLKRS